MAVPTPAHALLIGAAALGTYPVLRGSGAETGLVGAELYARPAWLVAHALAMVGFVALWHGLQAVDQRAARRMLAGTLLVLPYYGAETYGLHAIGRHAVETGDGSLVAAADLFRYEPVALTTFGVGLLAMAWAGVRLLQLIPTTTGPARWGLTLTGLGLATYLPQFFVPIEGRIIHGVLLAAGIVLLTRTIGRTKPGV